MATARDAHGVRVLMMCVRESDGQRDDGQRETDGDSERRTRS